MIGPAGENEVLFFVGFALDLGRGQLRDADGTEIPLRRKSFDLLRVFAENAGRTLGKDMLLDAVWPQVHVTEDSLVQCVRDIRRALRDEGGGILRTVARRGYLLDAEVRRECNPSQPIPKATSQTPDSLPDAEPFVAAPRPTAPHYAIQNIAAAAVTSMLIVAGGLWWLWSSSKAPSSATLTPPVAVALSAPRLSIVVLPFANLSNDPEQQYFADGITEDLTTDLSRIPGMLVISRNTAFTYKGKPVTAKQIGKNLGVRYVIEGSVQRAGNRVRITAQLIDAETEAHLWAERAENEISDLFALQNVMTSRIANTLSIELIAAEVGRPIGNPDAVDYILRGRDARAKGAGRENREKAIDLFERALALDPGSVEAQSRLAAALVSRGTTVTDTTDFQRAETLISQALAASPRDAYAHFVKGRLFMAGRRCEEAIPEFETGLALDRNLVDALQFLSVCKFLTGSGDAAIPLAEQAIQLSPRDPNLSWKYAWLGFVHLMQSRTDEAIVWLVKARSADPLIHNARYFLASAYGIKGELDRAVVELAEARRLNPTDRYSTIARVRANGDLNTPAVRTQFETIFLAGLRKAGMPEE